MAKVSKELAKLYAAYLDVFSTPNGKLILEEWKTAYHDRLSFNKDPYITAFNEGRREVYLNVITNLAIGEDLARNARTSTAGQIKSEFDESASESGDE